jgi:hypothetical protein
MKSTICFFALAWVAAVVSCTPYRQESGKPMPPEAPGASLPPAAGPSIQTETPSITPQGGVTPPTAKTDYPYAEKTSTEGEVLSPYAPYNVMDVRGLRSGQLALDPSCQKKFRVP